MRRLALALWLLSAPLLAVNTWHVSTTGVAGNTGVDLAHAWDLSSALKKTSAVVLPGDTIYIHGLPSGPGGTYTSANGGGCNGVAPSHGYAIGLQGTSPSHITVQVFPGDHVAIDLNGCTQGLISNGQPQAAQFVDIKGDWELEVYTNGSRSGSYMHGLSIQLAGDSLRWMNIITHDNIHGGGMVQSPASGGNNDWYGIISYYNAADNQEHGSYIRNVNGTVTVKSSVFFNNCGLGMQGFPHAGEDINLNLPTFEDVGAWNNGVLGPCTPHLDLLMGGEVVTKTPVIRRAMSWKSSGVTDEESWFGYSSSCTDLTLVDSWISSRTVFKNCLLGSPTITGNVFYNSNATLTGNSFDCASGCVTLQSLGTFPTNTYLTSAPGSPWINVVPNAFLAGKGLIIYRNWGGGGTLTPDVSSILTAGHNWSAYWAGNFTGISSSTPVATGTNFGGTTISITLSGFTMKTPIGGASWPAPPTTGTTGGAFILVDTGAGSTPTASATPTSTPTFTPITNSPTPTATVTGVLTNTPTPNPIGPVHWCVCPGYIFRCEHLPTTPSSHNDVCPTPHP